VVEWGSGGYAGDDVFMLPVNVRVAW